MSATKRILALSILGGIFVAAFGIVGVVSAQQATLTSEQAAKIRDNCTSIKNRLDQLHVSDAYLRVNRGQVYESIATKLMDRFNARLKSNDFDNSEFTTTTVSYRSALDSFRLHYREYEQQLSSTLSIDCAKRPSDFYSSVESARSKRVKVHEDVQQLNEYVVKYKESVDKFYTRYEQVATGVGLE